MYLVLQVFIPDYNVSVAELVIPGSDLSQHIRCGEYLAGLCQFHGSFNTGY